MRKVFLMSHSHHHQSSSAPIFIVVIMLAAAWFAAVALVKIVFRLVSAARAKFA